MDKVVIGSNEFGVEVAVTEEEQASGLMWRESPIPVMAFPFETSKLTKFWMKNTYVPLDILFCNSGKVVSCHYGIPLSERLVGPNSPTDLVVEFPAGTVDKLGIRSGDDVSLRLSVKTVAKMYKQRSVKVS